MSLDRRAEELWRDYLAETNPDAKEMLYIAYLQAVRRTDPDKESTDVCYDESGVSAGAGASRKDAA